MEVHFYQLQHSPLAKVLFDLSQRCLQNGWRVNIVAPSAAQRIDDMLWSFDDAGFFPHATDQVKRAKDQPVLISEEESKANDPSALIVTGMGSIEKSAVGDYARVSLVFDGRNPDELQNARALWKTLTGAGIAAKFWSQEDGPWAMKAANDAK